MFFLFFLFNWRNFLIPAVIEQIFSPIAELVIRTGLAANEVNRKNEKEPVTVAAKIRWFPA